MFKNLILIILTAITIAGCSRRLHPEPTAAAVENKETKVKKLKTAVPKVIVVNDNAAHKSPDGRYYYDVEGHRYWRNKKDGKYYLYNKSMYDDPAFKP